MITIVQQILKSIEDHSSDNAFCIEDVFYTYSDFAKYISKGLEKISNVSLSCINISPYWEVAKLLRFETIINKKVIIINLHFIFLSFIC